LNCCGAVAALPFPVEALLDLLSLHPLGQGGTSGLGQLSVQQQHELHGSDCLATGQQPGTLNLRHTGASNIDRDWNGN